MTKFWLVNASNRTAHGLPPLVFVRWLGNSGLVPSYQTREPRPRRLLTLELSEGASGNGAVVDCLLLLIPAKGCAVDNTIYIDSEQYNNHSDGRPGTLPKTAFSLDDGLRALPLSPPMIDSSSLSTPQYRPRLRDCRTLNVDVAPAVITFVVLIGDFITIFRSAFHESLAPDTGVVRYVRTVVPFPPLCSPLHNLICQHTPPFFVRLSGISPAAIFGWTLRSPPTVVRPTVEVLLLAAVYVYWLGAMRGLYPAISFYTTIRETLTILSSF